MVCGKHGKVIDAMIKKNINDKKIKMQIWMKR